MKAELSFRYLGLVDYFLQYTLLTPTYNRKHTLGRLYKSLCAQTFRDFEWVIVDDGSTDDTRQLVSSWQSFFPIRYFWKANGGKHTAVNLGVSAALGKFIAIVDSDDCCAPNALERFDYQWAQISQLANVANMWCLVARPDETLIGNPYPEESRNIFSFADQLRYRICDRWVVNRTDILRQFPWPEGEPFCPESLVWNRISREYGGRYFNEVLLIAHPSRDSLSRKQFLIRAQSPRTTLMHYRELLCSPAPPLMRLRAAANYARFALLAKMPRPFLYSLLSTDPREKAHRNSDGIS